MSKNKILFLILNFFLLICESIDDKNNIFDNIKVFNSSNILKKNIINRKEIEKYLRLLDEEDTADDIDSGVDDKDSIDTDISYNTIEIDNRNYIHISFTLLQTRKNDSLLFLYILTNSTFPENITFKLSISVYLPSRIRNLEVKNEFIIAKQSGSFKSNNNNNNHRVIILSADLNELEYIDIQNIQKIVLKNIANIDGNNFNDVSYVFDINLLTNTDTSTVANIDLSSLDENTNAYIYLEEKVSSCSNELQFNFTVNNDININERSIKLVISPFFNSTFGNYRNSGNSGNYRNSGNSGNYGNFSIRSFGLSVECVLSSDNKNIIPCQLEQEISQIPFTLSTFMEYIEDKLVIIKPLNPDSTFTLVCYEEPPIAAIISIVVLFFFVVIVVIIIIIVMNKKGRGDRGYELPNESNNILGMGGGASK